MTQGSLREDLLDRVRDLEPLIRKHADDNERERHLADPIVEGVKAANLFRMVNAGCPLTGAFLPASTARTIIGARMQSDQAHSFHWVVQSGRTAAIT